ncbi:DUF1176 domain-containing protein [Porphyrobacter sp. ULC335]|uniref:DUF1176 domain-containing protein n=1 Tax=Porphyrobacter sp. ULC335 TaxID=2854260 RepID=UPI0022210EC5|nr:DUF1176 domain-containing protein [Porphyrobacter sp. ULC335]UYV17090.1 DUF1176 domain-containing protein [Porphyrobacter sp. ULC335]
MGKLSLLAAGIALLMTGPLRAEDSEPGEWIAPEVAEFSDWSVACDNGRECTAVSLSRDYLARIAMNDPGDYALPKLWLKRRPGPSAPLRVFIDTTVWGEAGGGPGPASLHVYFDCDGDCTGRAYRLLPIEPGRFELAPQDVAAFLAESIQSSRAATRFADGEMHGTITTAGLTAVVRFIDEAQGRRGTVTATFGKGPRPARSVPPGPPLPRVAVVRGEEVDANATLATDTMLLVARAQLCPQVSLEGPDPSRARFRLETGQYLWALGCSGNPHAPRRLWLIETPGQGIAPYLVPRPEQGRAAELPILPNSDFDPASGQITAYSDGKCGWRRRWAWTGKEFQMVDAVEMPSCYGIPLHQWLQTYRAVPD